MKMWRLFRRKKQNVANSDSDPSSKSDDRTKSTNSSEPHTRTQLFGTRSSKSYTNTAAQHARKSTHADDSQSIVSSTQTSTNASIKAESSSDEPQAAQTSRPKYNPAFRQPTPSRSNRHASDADYIGEIDGKVYIECPLCVLVVCEDSTPKLGDCRHRACMDCMQRYVTTEINHSRLNITCPICSQPLHPNVIKNILQDEKFYFKYESFMLRRVLAADPDARWCPAPDCGYAVLAYGCASCPKLTCGREGCNTSFCYHCKQEWHPNQTCNAASIQRNKRNKTDLSSNVTSSLIAETSESTPTKARRSSKAGEQNSIRPEDIRECPVCASRIIKMNDGSCNHMSCSICGTRFCWLCMKEITDLHYFSPSGCTFWGKKPWSRKKKLLWQLGMLVGAPVCIGMLAGIAVPAIIIGVPIYTARKLSSHMQKKQFGKYRKNATIFAGTLLSFLAGPFISVFVLSVGVPILLGYVYGVVPLSLCRSSGGCLSASSSVENVNQDMQTSRAYANMHAAADVVSIDTAASNKLGDPSIGDTFIYLSDISLETNSVGVVTNVDREDRESASYAALAGSIASGAADDGNSTRALAGSIISKDSRGYVMAVSGTQNATQNQHNQQQSSIASTTEISKHAHALVLTNKQTNKTPNNENQQPCTSKCQTNV